MRGGQVDDYPPRVIFFGTTPRREHWRLEIGGSEKEAAVWLRETSFAKASDTASG